MADVEVLVLELTAVDALAAHAVTRGDVAALASMASTAGVAIMTPTADMARRARRVRNGCMGRNAYDQDRRPGGGGRLQDGRR